MPRSPSFDLEPPMPVSVSRNMATKLDKTIRREIEIDGETFTISVSPEGIRLTKKRFRSGVAVSWKSLWGRHVAEAPSLPDSSRER